MVPYIHVPDLHIGPIPIHPFGLLVATGVLTGTSIATRRAQKLGYDVVQFNSFVTWMLVAAFLLSHFLDSIFYHWDEVVAHPWFLFMPWMGLSSFGGFFGAVVGILLWRYYLIEESDPHWRLAKRIPKGILAILDLRLRARPRPMPILPFADLVLSVLPIGWMFGRAGCSTVHDHLGGRASPDTLLAVEHPLRAGDGLVTHIGFIEFIHGHDPRFDLGFLELLFTIVLAACFALTWRRRIPMGSYVIVTAIAYAPVRFAMDFLRLPESEGGDTRYAGLTPAQYGCVVLFLFGIAMIPYVYRLRASGIDPASAVRVPSAKPDAQAIA